MSLDNMKTMPKNISWAPKRPKSMDYEHQHSIFEKNGTQSADYIIAPDWVSEEGDPTTPFQARRYRPWAYEFQGARCFPWGTMERQIVTPPKKKTAQKADEEKSAEESSEQCQVGPAAESGDHCAPWKSSGAMSARESYIKPVRIPPPFRSVMQPRRVQDMMSSLPFQRSSTSLMMNPSKSMSTEEYDHLRERGYLQTFPTNLSTDGGFYRAKHTDDPLKPTSSTGTEIYYPEFYTHHGDNKKVPLIMPGSKITKLPYLNFSNAQWLTTFDVDKYNP